MASLCLIIGVIILFAVTLKIVLVWVNQAHKLWTCNISNPGIPWPILGHSQVFLNVAPEEIVDVLFRYLKQDKHCRKVGLSKAI